MINQNNSHENNNYFSFILRTTPLLFLQKNVYRPQHRHCLCHETRVLIQYIWIIDDDNKGNHSTTQNSHTFADQKDPEIRINRDNSYNLKYTSPSGATVNEAGTCSVNADAKTVTFHPSGKSDYTYKISAFTEEVFTLVATYDKTVSTTTAEAVVTTQTIQVDETLFLEDNE